MASVSFKTAEQVIAVAASKDARALINTYRSEEKPTNAVAAQSLQNLQETIDGLRINLLQVVSYLNYLITAGAIAIPAAIPAAGMQTTVRDQTLTAATTAITQARADAAGYWLVLNLIQDGTGGREITWDTMLKWAPVDIAPVASTVTQVVFVSREDPADAGNVNWFYVPLIQTGITP